MPIKTLEELQGLFITGATPSQQDFSDMLTTMFANDQQTQVTAQAAAESAAASAAAAASAVTFLILNFDSSGNLTTSVRGCEVAYNTSTHLVTVTFSMARSDVQYLILRMRTFYVHTSSANTSGAGITDVTFPTLFATTTKTTAGFTFTPTDTASTSLTIIILG
jgi:hypothetical protein